MAVYFFAAINRHDMETYARYEAEGFSSIEKYGVEVLAVCDTPQVIETEPPGQRIILLRFPDQAALNAWYGSPEYQAAIPLRHASAETMSLFSFEGVDS
jgi:uncharacterized protein (DUF1330 family)